MCHLPVIVRDFVEFEFIVQTSHADVSGLLRRIGLVSKKARNHLRLNEVIAGKAEAAIYGVTGLDQSFETRHAPAFFEGRHRGVNLHRVFRLETLGLFMSFPFPDTDRALPMAPAARPNRVPE